MIDWEQIGAGLRGWATYQAELWDRMARPDAYVDDWVGGEVKWPRRMPVGQQPTVAFSNKLIRESMRDTRTTSV